MTTISPGLLEAVEHCLQEAIAHQQPTPLSQGMDHALFPGGRRLRPAVVMRLGEALGVSACKLVPAAAAVEMVHGYSLVHDDLPELDGDAVRRGKPSVHVAFGHAQALLIGDALHSGAFRLLLEAPGLDDQARCLVTHELAMAAAEMAAGQFQELLLTAGSDEKTLLDMYGGKTGALFGAAWAIPAVLSGVRDQAGSFRRQGVRFGMAFQLQDDLHDLPQDQREGKISHPILFGSATTEALLADLLGEARQFLDAACGLPSVLDELWELIG